MRRLVCLRAVVILGLLSIVADVVDAQIPGGAFTTATVEASPYNIPPMGAVAVGADGLGLIVYAANASITNENGLKVAHCSNPACTSVTTAILDTASIFSVSAAIGTDGRALIAYRRSDGTEFGSELRVAHCSDPLCTAATISAPLSAEEDDVNYPSIAIGDDGLGLILYNHHNTSGVTTVEVAHCADVACTTGSPTILDSSVFDPVFSSSIVTGADGLGLFVYAMHSTKVLKVGHCSNPSCSSAGITTIATNVISVNDIVIGADGLGLISYRDEEMGLMVAHCLDGACSAVTKSAVGAGGPMVIGNDGHVLIASGGAAFGGTVFPCVAHCNDVPCTTVTTAPIEYVPFGGWLPIGIAIGGDGRPLLVHHVHSGNPRHRLMVAHQAPRGDFNTDGRQDLLWRRDGSGDNLVWFMDGADLIGASFTNPPTLADADWRLAGATDFNGDAQTDLLWRHSGSGQNAVWFMNGTSLVSGTPTTTLADTRWQIGGTGDFDRDGRPDILWRHLVSGENAVWYMNGATLASGTFLTPSSLPDVGWQIGGTGDFDRNGHADILWHHQVSGQLVVWYMNGSVLTSGTFTDPPALPDTAWKVAAVGDYDANGRPDLVWHNPSSGQAVVWFMNGATLTSGTFTNPSTFPDTNWKLVGPR
jgi:hypothetical protein